MSPQPSSVEPPSLRHSLRFLIHNQEFVPGGRAGGFCPCLPVFVTLEPKQTSGRAARQRAPPRRRSTTLIALENLGWIDFFESQLEQIEVEENTTVARVI